MVYSGNQWISFDDIQSFGDKKKFLSSRCLGGLMIWAVDQDTQDNRALAALLGDDAVGNGLIQGGELDDEEKAALSAEFAAYNGQNCYITPGCTDGTRGQQGPDQVCKASYTALDGTHVPRLLNNGVELQSCNKGFYHQICCPTAQMPKNCRWQNTPGPNGECGREKDDGACGNDRFLLSLDRYADKWGDTACSSLSDRAFCCDSTEALNKCHWSDCSIGDSDGKISGGSCRSGEYPLTTRRNDGKGILCDRTNMNLVQTFCCPSRDTYKNCQWETQALHDGSEAGQCQAVKCDAKQVAVTHALVPEPNFATSGTPQAIQDCGAKLPTDRIDFFSYCCDPPSEYEENWPVSPAKLWANPHYKDVEWQYADNFGNNNKDTKADGQDAFGDDPYGFVMLDGSENAISHSFSSDFTVVRRNEKINVTKRSIITRNQSIIDTTFDHKEETMHVFCNHRSSSSTGARCNDIFLGGAKDTIIKLPAHEGEGPFGRVVSMELVDGFQLPDHHIRARELKGNTNAVYKVKYDYSFNLIRRADDPVNLRVDYTNLLPYWDEMTDSDPSKRKRSEMPPVPPRPGTPEFDRWREKRTVKRQSNTVITTGSTQFSSSSDSLDPQAQEGPGDARIGRRWFGFFTTWLRKLSTVEFKDKGELALGLDKSLLIYSARTGCSGSTLQAGLDINADAQIAMNARYAYYLSGTLVPPVVDDTFAYFGLQPSVYLGIRMNGNAILRYESDRKKLIDTLSYPGLSVRGIAAVGPTLDLYGQLKGQVKLSGQMQIGASYKFEPAEVYWPQDDDSKGYQKIKDLVGSVEIPDAGLEPRFSASVAASADFDVLMTPEAKMGIKINGGIMDAQLVGFVNNTLRFHIEGKGSTGSGGNSYDYGVYFLYNLGVGSFGNFLSSKLGIGWNVPPRQLFNSEKSIKLYPRSGPSKRSYIDDTGTATLTNVPRRGLLNGMGNQGLVALEDGTKAGQNYSFRLEKRLTVADITQFASGLLQCPDATDCNGPGAVEEGAGGSEDSCPVGSKIRRAGGGPCLTPNPGGQTCTDIQPRLMCEFYDRCNVYRATNVSLDNCEFMKEQELVNNNGNTVVLHSVCYNIRSAMQRAGVANEFQLTWNPEDANRHRSAVCPSNPSVCSAKNQKLDDDFSQGDKLTSCDEFPFASTEEGGRPLDTVLQFQPLFNPQLIS